MNKIQMRRHAMVWAIFLALVLVAPGVAGAAGSKAAYKSYRQGGQAAFYRNDLASAESYHRQAVGEAEQFGKPTEELAESLSGLAAVYQNTRRFKEAESAYERALMAQTAVSGTNKIELLEILVNLGVVRQWEEKFEGALDAYRQAQRVVERKYNAKHPLVVLTLTGQGKAYEAMNRLEEAGEVFNRAAVLAQSQDLKARSKRAPIPSSATFWLYRQVRPGDLPWWMDIAEDIGDFHLRQKRFTEAEVQFRRMTKIAEMFGSNATEDTAAAFVRLGEVLREQKRFDEAEPVLERAIGLHSTGRKYSGLMKAMALHQLMAVYLGQNRLEDADACLKRLWGEEVGTRVPNFVQENHGLVAIASSYAVIRQPGKGEHMLKTALEIKEQVWGLLDPALVPILQQTAVFYITQQRLEPADQTLQRALQLLKVAKTPSLLDSMLVLATYGELKILQKDPRTALSYYEQAFAFAERAVGETHATLLPVLEKMIAINEELKQTERNELLHQRVIAIKEKQLGREEMETAEAIMRLGENFLALKKYAEAEKYLVRVYTMETKARGDDSMLLLKPITKLVEVYTAMGKDAEREPLLKHQVLIFEKLYGPKNAVLKKPLEDCVAVLRKLKRDAEAKQMESRIKALDPSK